MPTVSPPRPLRAPVQTLVSRLGHDAVWLAIAGLFCVVEGAVKVTEISPARFLRARRAAAHRRAAQFQLEPDRPQAYAR